MRIALYSNIEHQVPPPKGRILAPWVLTYHLANSLVDLGHEVWLYGLKECQTKAHLVHHNISIEEDFYVKGVKDYPKVDFLDHALLSTMFSDANRGMFDVVHVNYWVQRAIHFVNFTSTPTTITLHDPMNKPYYYDLYRTSPNLHLTPISNNQKATIPDLPYTDVVYNGIDVEQYPYKAEPGEYLLYSGRINPVKGVHIAIEVAKRSDLPLVIAGEVYHKDPAIEKYWLEEIKPHIDDKQIRYVGALNLPQLAEYYQNAKALIFPTQWREPFGLVMTEAMSCGTPVIAFRKGAVPEVIEDGKTGYVVDTVDEMVTATHKIDQINRLDCRLRVEQHFSMEAMVQGYLNVYHQLLASKNGKNGHILV